MTFSKAKKLHNEDEVIIKSTGAVATVLGITVRNKTVQIHCCCDGTLSVLPHTEVR